MSSKESNNNDFYLDSKQFEKFQKIEYFTPGNNTRYQFDIRSLILDRVPYLAMFIIQTKKEWPNILKSEIKFFKVPFSDSKSLKQIHETIWNAYLMQANVHDARQWLVKELNKIDATDDVFDENKKEKKNENVNACVGRRGEEWPRTTEENAEARTLGGATDS